MARRLALLLFATGVLCVASGKLGAAPRVTVSELRAADAWRVVWEFDDEVSGLSFRRGREPFRNGRWTIVEPAGAAWGVVAGRDAVIAGDGARRIVLEFPSDFRRRQKDYDINVAFTDGSRLFYTGHLATESLQPCASCPSGVGIAEGTSGEFPWRFVTDRGRTVRLLDRSGRGELDWTPRPGREREDGTYVYFGSIEPAPSESMTLLVDPGMPRWLVDGIRAEFPRMFEYYARLTGVRLDFVPLVLLSYEPTDRPGMSFAGGTLEGLVQIAADGKAWATKTPEAERLWFRHLAHEAFHFWDGQMFRADEESEWLSEAAAEYASFLALRDRELVDDAELERALVEQCNDCLVRARGLSIAEAPSKGNFDIVYSCGLVTQLLADRAIARGSRGTGIGDLYRRLFVADGDRRYGAADFVRLVGALSDRWTTSAVSTLVNEGVSREFDVFLAESLRHAGMRVTLGGADEAAITQMAAREEARSLVSACACSVTGDGLCSSPETVVCVDGWSVRSAPERSVRALADAAEHGGAVTVTERGGVAPRALVCPAVARPHRRLLVLE